MTKKGIILLLIAIAGFAFIIWNYNQQANRKLGTGAPQASLSKDGQIAKDIFAQSLEYSNQKDVKKYIALLVPSARKNTENQLTTFFKDYDVENTLKSFRLLDKSNGHMLGEAVVLSVNKDKNQKKYKDNQSTIDVSYVQQKDGSWLIDLTTTTNTQILTK